MNGDIDGGLLSEDEIFEKKRLEDLHTWLGRFEAAVARRSSPPEWENEVSEACRTVSEEIERILNGRP